MAGYPKPYKWLPKNPEKYVGDPTKIIVRSSWERQAMIFFDTNPSVIKWNSEEIAIPYLCPTDGKLHRYFPDFLVQVKKTDGTIENTLVEVKPYAQTIPPKNRKNKNKKTQLNEVTTYLKNQAKWEAAELWCKKNNMKFIFVTEYQLGIKKRK